MVLNLRGISHTLFFGLVIGREDNQPLLPVQALCRNRVEVGNLS
jgi:hypothetical protein